LIWLRQALAAAAGDHSIFVARPIAASLLAVGAAILRYAVGSALTRR